MILVVDDEVVTLVGDVSELSLGELGAEAEAGQVDMSFNSSA